MSTPRNLLVSPAVQAYCLGLSQLLVIVLFFDIGEDIGHLVESHLNQPQIGN